jgi:hypothetical protein
MTNTVELKYGRVPGSDVWTKGTAGAYTFSVKHFDNGSLYGIDEGRISKLEICDGYKILANYDRGWDIEPTADALDAYAAILREFN